MFELKSHVPSGHVLPVLIAVLLVFGCKPAQTKKSDKALARGTPSQNTTAPISGKDTKVIRPGYGTARVHVGMKAEELVPDWERPEAEVSDNSLFNERLGVAVNLRDGRVHAVFFRYKSRDYHAFDGSIDKGLHANASPVDVRQKYGVPSYILKTTQSEFGEFPGARQLEISYVEQGIEFRFTDDELATVLVTAPQKDFDYDYWKQIMGDSLIYIRPPETRGVVELQSSDDNSKP